MAVLINYWKFKWQRSMNVIFPDAKLGSFQAIFKYIDKTRKVALRYKKLRIGIFQCLEQKILVRRYHVHFKQPYTLTHTQSLLMMFLMLLLFCMWSDFDRNVNILEKRQVVDYKNYFSMYYFGFWVKTVFHYFVILWSFAHASPGVEYCFLMSPHLEYITECVETTKPKNPDHMQICDMHDIFCDTSTFFRIIINKQFICLVCTQPSIACK